MINCNHCRHSDENDLCDKGHPERRPGQAWFAPRCPDYNVSIKLTFEEMRLLLKSKSVPLHCDVVAQAQLRKTMFWIDEECTEHPHKVDALTRVECKQCWQNLKEEANC